MRDLVYLFHSLHQKPDHEAVSVLQARACAAHSFGLHWQAPPGRVLLKFGLPMETGEQTHVHKCWLPDETKHPRGDRHPRSLAEVLVGGTVHCSDTSINILQVGKQDFKRTAYPGQP
jgi:hypothetical protein